MVFRAGDPGSRVYIILSGSCSILCPKRTTGELSQTAVLRPSDCFGEAALRNSQPRAYTVLAREDTHFASLDRSDYHQAFGFSQENGLQEKIAFLRKIPIFAQWTQSAAKRLSYFFQEKRYQRKQVLFKAGASVTTVYIVKSGEFALKQPVTMTRKRDPLHCEEKTHFQVEVTLEREGELLGAFEALNRVPHRYTCHCNSSQAAVLAIEREDFEDLLTEERFLASLKSMLKVKEQGRLGRLNFASELVRKEQSRSDVSLKNMPDLESRVKRKLKSRLIKHSVNLMKPRLSFTPDSVAPIPSYREVVSLDVSPTLTSNPPSRLNHKTWTDIMSAKLFPETSNRTKHRRNRTIINIHTQHQRVLQHEIRSQLSSPPSLQRIQSAYQLLLL